MESQTAVDRVLIEAHNLIDSGHDRVNIGGIWICWYCGQPDRTHDPHCMIKSLTEAMNAYRETPKFILGLDPQAQTRLEFEALHGKEADHGGSPLLPYEFDYFKQLDHDQLRPTTREFKRLINHIEWQAREFERLQGDQTFRTAVRDLLEKMRAAGGDATGMAMYMYRRGGNRRPDGDPRFGRLVESVVVALETVWGMLGGDPRKSS